MKNNLIKAVLDIGNFKIKALVGEINKDTQKYEILGYSEKYSQGIKKSVIEDPESLSKTIQSVLQELEAVTGLSIDKVTIGVGGQFIKSRTTNARNTFSEKEIEKEDLENLFTIAEKEMLLKGEMVLKREIYNMRVNNSGIIRNPIGHIGKEIQGDIHFVIVDQAYVDQITEMVNRAGFKVEDVTLNIFAASKSLLTEEDTKMGVAVIDIGEGSTDIIIFKNDKMIYTQSIPLGGMHYLSDLSYISKKSKIESFEILTKLIKKNITVEEGKKYIYYGNNEKIEYTAVKNIIDARTGDVINFITGAIEESGFKGYLGKGLVFTGGTIGIEEVIEGIANKMTYQVRKSSIKPISGLEEIKSGMSTAVGMFLEILKNETDKENEVSKKVKPEVETPKIEEIIEEKKEEEIFTIDENILKESTEEEAVEKKKSAWSSIKEMFSSFM